MPTSLQWRARLRAEYRWPYPALEPGRWYAVRPAALALEPGKYLWLDVEPYPVEVFTEHLEPVRLADEAALDAPADDTVECRRLARLRAEAAARYPDLPAGVWGAATDVASSVARWSPPRRRPDGRRRMRLPDADFEFRTETTPAE